MAFPFTQKFVHRDYTQLSYRQRCIISALKAENYSQKEIAERLNVHPSTISRELKRHTDENGIYSPDKAHLAYLANKAKRTFYKITDEIKNYIIKGLKRFWSPEQIIRTINLNISHEAIYQFIYKDMKAGGSLWENLRFKRKKRRKRAANKAKRGQISDRVDISLRPKTVDENTQVGHWEADTVVLAEKKGCIVTLVERVTKFTLTALLPDRKAETVKNAIIARFKHTPLPVLTVTYDNGKEFAEHVKINKALKCNSYFCTPYHSWERVPDENTNGLLRQYIPKKAKYRDLKYQHVRFATNELNDRPRKKLNFLTPREAMKKYLLTLTIIALQS